MDFTQIPYLIDRRGHGSPTLWRVVDVATHNGDKVVELEDANGIRSQVGKGTDIYVHKTVSLDAEFIEDQMKHGAFEAIYPKVDVPEHLDAQMEEHLTAEGMRA